MSLKISHIEDSGQSTGRRLNSSARRKRVVPLSYQLAGLGLNLVSYLGNEWASDKLSRFWFTVFKGKAKPWIAEFWQQADTRTDVQLGNKSIPVSFWGQGPLVVVMHGWSGSGVQFRHMIPGLVAAGYRVAVFDAPAHGSNPGGNSHLLEFSDSLVAIQQQIGPIETVIAHSLGGMAAVFASQRGLSVRRMVLLGPHLDLQKMYRTYSDLLNLNPRLSARFRHKIGRKMADIIGIDDVWALFTPANLLSQSDYGGLLIYDSQDEEIPQDQFEAVAQSWRGCQVIKTDGLGHRHTLKDEGVIKSVLAYMRKLPEIDSHGRLQTLSHLL